MKNQNNRDRSRSHLERQRHTVGDLIVCLSLATNQANLKQNSKLFGFFSAYQSELDRRLENDPGTPEWFDRLVTVNYMGLLLMSQHIDERQLTLAAGEPISRLQRKIGKVLIAALTEFSLGMNDLATRFPKPDIGRHLPKKFFFNFYEMTREEAEKDAAEALANIAAVTPSTIEEVEAKIADLSLKNKES